MELEQQFTHPHQFEICNLKTAQFECGFCKHQILDGQGGKEGITHAHITHTQHTPHTTHTGAHMHAQHMHTINAAKSTGQLVTCIVHNATQLASNPGSPFRILSCSFFPKLRDKIRNRVLQSCETNSKQRAWVRGYNTIVVESSNGRPSTQD